MIHLTAKVLHAIAHHKIVDMQQKIVNRNLVEHLLRERDVWGLVLHNHSGLCLLAVDNRVATEVFLPDLQLHLVGK